MKLRVLCTSCTTPYVDEHPLVEQRDDALYRVTCSQGHETVVWLQNFKFELLLDSGGMALLDGYKYEAVSSISASFERFLEFYIQVIIRKREISSEAFDCTWKRVKKQSERQIGSFLFVYLLENKRSPNFIEEERFAFRNNVIHQGYIPAYEEVIAYGERIFQFIRELLNELKATSQDGLRLKLMEISRQASTAHANLPFSVMHIPTMIDHLFYPPNEGPRSFEEGLAHLKQVKPRAYET